MISLPSKRYLHYFCQRSGKLIPPSTSKNLTTRSTDYIIFIFIWIFFVWIKALVGCLTCVLNYGWAYFRWSWRSLVIGKLKVLYYGGYIDTTEEGNGSTTQLEAIPAAPRRHFLLVWLVPIGVSFHICWLCVNYNFTTALDAKFYYLFSWQGTVTFVIWAQSNHLSKSMWYLFTFQLCKEIIMSLVDWMIFERYSCICVTSWPKYSFSDYIT